MPSTITSNFRVVNALNFINEGLSNNRTYMFIGKHTSWNGSSTDFSPPIPYSRDDDIQRSHWIDMIAAKRVTSSEASLGVRRINWVTGTVYDQYSASDADLYLKDFYVLADGNVYKCVSNGSSTNNGVARTSTVKPTGTAPTMIGTSDGYVWKYMYTIGAEDSSKFLTSNFMPVPSITPAGNVSTFGGVVNPIGNDLLGTVVEGHGSNAAIELRAFYVLINQRFDRSENGVISTTNDYRKIGLVYNPRLNGSNNLATGNIYDTRTKLKLSGLSGSFSRDSQVVVTMNNVPVNAVVEDVSADYIWITGNSVDILNPNANNNTVSVTSDNGTASVIEVQNSGLKRYSGNVLFIENRVPIYRAPDQTESLNIILEF